MLNEWSAFPADGLIEGEPRDWRSLQTRSAAILNESGLVAENDCELKLVRGTTDVDVYASDHQSTPPSALIIECKHWGRRVPKSIVHGFRTVISESGVNTGIVLSCTGFQRGAREAADKSNCVLTDWSGFNSLFIDRWITNHFVPGVRHTCEVVQQYAEPSNAVVRAASGLGTADRARFHLLRDGYDEFAFLTMALGQGRWLLGGESGPTTLPLGGAITTHLEGPIAERIAEASTFRALADEIASIAEVGTVEFNEVFGSEIPDRMW